MSKLTASEERLLKVIFGDKIAETNNTEKEERTMANEFVVIAEFHTAFGGDTADDVRVTRRIGPCSKQEAEETREQLENKFSYPGCLSAANRQKTRDDIDKLYAHLGGDPKMFPEAVFFTVEEVFHCDPEKVSVFLAKKGGE